MYTLTSLKLSIQNWREEIEVKTKHFRSTMESFEVFLFWLSLLNLKHWMQRRENECFFTVWKEKEKNLTSLRLIMRRSRLHIYLKETGCTDELSEIFCSMFSFREVEGNDFLWIELIYITKTTRRTIYILGPMRIHRNPRKLGKEVNIEP
jgi:hypothetical protein